MEEMILVSKSALYGLIDRIAEGNDRSQRLEQHLVNAHMRRTDLEMKINQSHSSSVTVFAASPNPNSILIVNTEGELIDN